MNRGFLKFAAVVLGTALIVVPFLGLDGLPRDVRRQIGTERTLLAAAQKHIQIAQQQVAHDLATEPDLFHGIPESQAWPGELAADAAGLQSAGRGMEQLNALEKQNRRADRERALSLLVQERGERESAANQAAGIEQAADHWVELKQHLPETLARMDRDYRMIQSVNSAPLAAEVQKAEAAWPDKRGDLESRFDSEIHGRQQQDEQLWQSTAQARQEAAAGHLPAAQIGTLVEAADKLHADSALLPQKRAEIEGLVAQLNTTWDKVLVDMEKHGGTYREDIRTIRTPQGGQTTSGEQWVEVSAAQYNGVKNDLGMAIEHKPAGKYDSEAERVAQPAGFAYMAPPGQTNQYGYWEHRDGRDFWVFYGQYALLRDLLFNYHYQPLPRYDWEEYRDYRSRGQTYYGRDEANSIPKYGSQGSSTIDRYAGSNYARSGGFRNSPYASKSGSFRDSQFATPGGNSAPKRFGSGSRPQEPGFTFHSNPRPRPSFRMPSSGRRFGRH
jgi:hypothetical protein